MKKTFNLLILLMAVALCAACHKDHEEEDPEQRENTMLADNLYGIEYDDYDFEACVRYYDRHRPKELAAACSEVRKGRMVGRNLDYYINRNACAIIKVNACSGRYASIGIVGCCGEFSQEVAHSGKPHEIYRYLPCRTSDGINENGVYIGVNVMPTGETSYDKSRWTPRKWGVGAAFTNPSSPHTLCTMYLTRFVLDNAKSVEHALELIRSVNWYEPVDYPHKGECQAFHWMLADQERNCVIEFLDNNLVVTETHDLSSPSLGTVMTNFTNAIYARSDMQCSGIGYERYDVLCQHYADTPETFEGMQELMKRVWFSKAYTGIFSPEGMWLTEFSNETYPAWTLYKHPEMLNDKEFRALVNRQVADWNNKANWYTDNTPLWFTVHTSIYDLATRRLMMLPHEGLGAQKSFRKFSLASSFDKPHIR